MINEGIEKYDAKIDRRFAETNSKLDRNVHETRNFRDTVNNQFYSVQTKIGEVKDRVREDVASQLEPVTEQLTGISAKVSATGGERDYKRWILPILISAAVLLFKVLDYVHK